MLPLLLFDELEPLVARGDDGNDDDEEEEDDEDDDDDDDDDWPLLPSTVVGLSTVPLPLELKRGGGPKASLRIIRSTNSLTSTGPK